MASIPVECLLLLVIMFRSVAENARRRVALLNMCNSLAKDGAVGVLRVRGENAKKQRCKAMDYSHERVPIDRETICNQYQSDRDRDFERQQDRTICMISNE